MKMQTIGRVSRPGKAKAIKPPMSKDTNAATGGAEAQRRLNEEAGVKDVERRRRRARERDSRGKSNAHSDRRGRALDCEHRRVERGELRDLREVERLCFGLEMSPAQEVVWCVLMMLIASHLRLGHLVLQAAMRRDRNVRERQRRNGKAGGQAPVGSGQERHCAARIADPGKSSKSGILSSLRRERRLRDARRSSPAATIPSPTSAR